MRPLCSKDSIHFVLRSPWARGSDSFLAIRNRKAIDNLIRRFAKKFGVRIYEQAVNGNHIHLLLRITNRPLYRSFIEAISGKIASHVMRNQSFNLFCRSRRISRRGDGSLGYKAATKSRGFWEFMPFSRVVAWGRDFKTCVSYLKQNVLEALGFISYKPRKNYYARWLTQTTPHLNEQLSAENSS